VRWPLCLSLLQALCSKPYLETLQHFLYCMQIKSYAKSDVRTIQGYFHLYLTINALCRSSSLGYSTCVMLTWFLKWQKKHFRDLSTLHVKRACWGLRELDSASYTEVLSSALVSETDFPVFMTYLKGCDPVMLFITEIKSKSVQTQESSTYYI
jgi:hypothetical protein